MERDTPSDSSRRLGAHASRTSLTFTKPWITTVTRFCLFLPPGGTVMRTGIAKVLASTGTMGGTSTLTFPTSPLHTWCSQVELGVVGLASSQAAPSAFCASAGHSAVAPLHVSA